MQSVVRTAILCPPRRVAGLAVALGALGLLLWLAAASPAAAQTLVGTPIPVSGGLATNGLAVDPTTNRVYVSVGDTCDVNNNCGGIAIIDGNTNTASATHIHPPTATPTSGCCVIYTGDLSIDASAHRLYVNGAYRVNAIDTTTNSPAGSSPGFTCGLNCPISMLAVNTANHRIFAPFQHFPGMQIVDGTTLNLIGGSNPLTTAPPQSTTLNPGGTASDTTNGHFYIAAVDQPNNGKVVVLDSNGTETSGPPSTGGNGCTNPFYLATNPNTQRVYVMANSSAGGACLGMLDGPSNTPIGSPLIISPSVAVAGGGPMAMDTATNRLYVLLGGTPSRIAVVDGATNTLIGSPVLTTGSQANAIAINVGLRRLYVSNADQNAVAVFDLGPGPTSTPTPIASPTATATATRTPTPTVVVCSPRPVTSVVVGPATSGTLRVTITAGASTGNRLQSLQFTRLTGAVVDVGSQVGQSAPFTFTVGGLTSQQFNVRRTQSGAAGTVELTVVDGCGSWPTFVGAGPNGWPPAPPPPDPTLGPQASGASAVPAPALSVPASAAGTAPLAPVLTVPANSANTIPLASSSSAPANAAGSAARPPARSVPAPFAGAGSAPSAAATAASALGAPASVPAALLPPAIGGLAARSGGLPPLLATDPRTASGPTPLLPALMVPGAPLSPPVLLPAAPPPVPALLPTSPLSTLPVDAQPLPGLAPEPFGPPSAILPPVVPAPDTPTDAAGRGRRARPGRPLTKLPMA
jgi:hypothetical protein